MTMTNTTKIILSSLLACGLAFGTAGCAHSQSGAVQPAAVSESEEAEKPQQNAAHVTADNGAESAEANENASDDRSAQERAKMERAKMMLMLQKVVFADAPPPPLIQAALKEDAGEVKKLIEQGADVNAWYEGPTNGLTALHVAAMSVSGNVETVETLIAAGADLNAANAKGITALMLAITGQNEDIARMLVKAGADVNAKDRRGQTPLMLAACQGEVSIVKALIEAKADVNAKDLWSQTALHVAAMSVSGNVETVETLIAAGADLNAANKKGITALMLAVASQNEDIARMLVKAGADVNAQDNDEKTALDFARTDEVKAVLTKAGAKAGK